MTKIAKEVKKELKEKFFPHFAKQMQEIREALEIMNDELDETMNKLEEILGKIDEIETMKEEII